MDPTGPTDQTDSWSAFRLMSFFYSLQPIGVATAQVLSLYATNVATVEFESVMRSLGLSAAAAFVVWLLLWRPLGDARKAALGASLVALAFWSSSSIMTALGPSDAAAGTLSIVAMVFLWPVLLPLVLWRLARTKQSLLWLHRVADFVAVGGVLVPLVTILGAAADGPGMEPAPTEATASLAETEASTAIGGRPDIYVIVLDGFGRDDELEEHFGIEPGLGSRLADLGFFVATQSNANYSTTLHAMPSMLNYDYVQNLTRQSTPLGLRDLIKRNRLTPDLQKRGYKIIAYSTGLDLTELKDANEYIEPPPMLELFEMEVRPNYFEETLLTWTPFGPFIRQTEDTSRYKRHRRLVQTTLADLPRHATNPNPTFVFAHVICPHEPFVFGENGEDVSPYDLEFKFNRIFEDPDLPDEPGRTGPEYRRRYRAQTIYLSGLVERSVQRILQSSPEPPIIIVQGDHGPYGFTPDIRQSRMAILNAYHLPDGGDQALYPSISPVNSMRVVLNFYFGAELPRLPDRLFRTSWTDANKLREVRPAAARSAR